VSWRTFLPVRTVCCSLLVFAGFATPVFAGTNENPHNLLSKSFQQADLWQHGPVKLVAKVRTYAASAQAQNLEYTVYWAGPEKWRAEWSAPDARQIAVLNNGKLSYLTSGPELLWSATELQAALAALDGGTPAGPYRVAPLAYESAKLHVSAKKIKGIEARCLGFGEPKTTLCINPSSGRLLTAESDQGSFAYGDYTTIGSNSYPQTVTVSSVHTTYEGDNYLWVGNGVSLPQDLKQVHVKTPVAQAQVTVTRGEQFPDSLFAAPEDGTTVDFASCADPATNFTAPRIEKFVKANRSDAARKEHRYGWVRVLATVGTDGSVRKTAVLSGDPALSSEATDAVRQYKYTPYRRCGEAAEFQQLVVVGFPPPGTPVYTDHSPAEASYPSCFPCSPN
jgi:Gram-negative bacterial TonB protein C-terminal